MVQLESEEINRVLDLCMRPRMLNTSSAAPAALLEEVSLDYLRAMNMIVLEAQIKKARVTVGYPKALFVHPSQDQRKLGEIVPNCSLPLGSYVLSRSRSYCLIFTIVGCTCIKGLGVLSTTVTL